jgi:hypothetical protein
MDTIRDDQTKIIFNYTLCRMMFVGQGFVTSQNVKGQILGLDSKGNVSAYKRLYDQKSLDELFPRAVTAMKSNWVMISSQVSCDQIPIGSIVRLNMVLPVDFRTYLRLSQVTLQVMDSCGPLQGSELSSDVMSPSSTLLPVMNLLIPLLWPAFRRTHLLVFGVCSRRSKSISTVDLKLT